MKVKNLFGETVEMETKPGKTFSSKMSHYQRTKMVNRYRKSTGAEKCKDCTNHLVFDYHNKYYHKCELIGVSH